MNVKGLTKRTKEKRESDVIYLSKKPIRELWEKLANIKTQQNHIFDLYVKATKTHNFKEVDRLEQESKELHEEEMDINDAIKRK